VGSIFVDGSILVV